MRAHLPLLTSRTADLALAGVRVPVFAELLMVRLFVATRTSVLVRWRVVAPLYGL